MKTVSSLPDPKDTPLRIQIIDGSLVLSIGIATLAFSAELQDEHYGFRELTVVNQVEFAKDVLRELNSEEEDGSTLITAVLDKAILNAIEQGSIAVRTNMTNLDEDDFGDVDE